MPINRLKLDFSLQYRDERGAFLDNYLCTPQFNTRPPTPEECETMANYLLWGKDRSTGLNAKQDGSVELTSKHGDWDAETSKLESLEALMESPTFNETQLQDMGMPATKIKREVFSRDEALAKCPEGMRETFLELFRRIDALDLKINYYELLHNKRTNPPRDFLLKKFSDEEQQKMQEAVTHWNQFMYLKQRHELVEMRRQQYTLRDSFVTQIQLSSYAAATPPVDAPDFDAGIEVLPLGTWSKTTAARLVFRPLDELVPEKYTEEQLRTISDFYWEKKSYVPSGTQKWIDFRQLEHVYEIFQLYFELEDVELEDEMGIEKNTNALMHALKYYIDIADLTDLQREILDMKIHKKKNTDIAYDINKKWKKSYTSNYISTIFRQRIIPKINEAAEYHMMIIGNLWFPEEFKVCTCCGKTLLRDPINFTRKTRSKDGFTSRCKKCEKAARAKED